MQEVYRLGEVEEIVSQMDLSEVDDDVALTEDDMEIVISGWYVYIPELNLRLHEGIVDVWDEKIKVYMPDFSATVLFEGQGENKDYLYLEHGDFASTIFNWLNGRMTVSEVEELKCEVCFSH